MYSLTGAAVAVSGGVHYQPGDDGGFDFPDALSDELRGFAVGGKPMWEDADQRRRRLIAEELERRQGPGAALAAFEQAMQAVAGPGGPPGAADA